MAWLCFLPGRLGSFPGLPFFTPDPQVVSLHFPRADLGRSWHLLSLRTETVCPSLLSPPPQVAPLQILSSLQVAHFLLHFPAQWGGTSSLSLPGLQGRNSSFSPVAPAVPAQGPPHVSLCHAAHARCWFPHCTAKLYSGPGSWSSICLLVKYHPYSRCTVKAG